MRYALLVLTLLPLAGCNVFENDVARGYEENKIWTTAATYTAADVRIITQRPHPLSGNQIVCTEPSPDVAKALSTALELTAKGQSGAAGASVGFAGGSAEAAAELAGRSTALLGLRDGLFKACEAYANGIIGDDAYALVLSRYGQLMTTLFLGQDITGAAGAEGRAMAVSPPLIVLNPGGQQPGGQQPPGTTPPATPPGANQSSTPRGGLLGASAAAITQMNRDYFDLDQNLTHLLVVACINENDPTRFYFAHYTNSWLQRICNSLNLDQILMLEQMQSEQVLKLEQLHTAGQTAPPANR